MSVQGPVYVVRGEVLPPRIVLSGDDFPLDLSRAKEVRAKVNYGEWERMHVLFPVDGVVQRPAIDTNAPVGTVHEVGYKILWDDGRTEIVPDTGPAEFLIVDNAFLDQLAEEPERSPRMVRYAWA